MGRIFLAFAVLWLASAAAAAEQQIALVIGNSAYADSPLSNPVNDAKLISAALRAQGFEVIEKLDVGQNDVKLAVKDHGNRHKGAPNYSPGETFRDCPSCPEMVVVPKGSYQMGSASGEEGRYSDEGPQHRVTIARAFAVGRYEVTFAEWDACVSAGGCGHRPEDWSWGRGDRPAMNVSWDDVQQYVAWLSNKTSQRYRLLSEAEWEYAARAGTRSRYWWGDDIGRGKANCESCGSRWDGERTAPVGSFAANPFGLYDVHGNVMEWVEDCWHDDYSGAPGDAIAWTGSAGCVRVMRDGAWRDAPLGLSPTGRSSGDAGVRYHLIGFRVARTLF